MSRHDPSAFGFEALREEHLALMAAWFAAPHLTRWWGDPADALAEIRAAMADPATDPYLVRHHGEPLGYIQLYRLADEPGHPYGDQPPGTAGIDQSIGDAGRLGQGLGSSFIRRFVEDRFAEGWRRIVTDPDPTNLRAIRAYEAAGFEALGERDTIFGHVLLMARDAPRED
jgi:aminoglycoside 6'-N-acetyltransferase